MFENVNNPFLKNQCIDFSFNEELAKLFEVISEQKYCSHTPLVFTSDFSNNEYQRILIEIKAHCNLYSRYKDVAAFVYWKNEVINCAYGVGEKEAYISAIKLIERNASEINIKFGLKYKYEQLTLF